jgi:alkyl hydroperoxide reductase subunit AhpF
LSKLIATNIVKLGANTFPTLTQDSFFDLSMFGYVILDLMHMKNYYVESVHVVHLFFVLKSHFQVYSISFINSNSATKIVYRNETSKLVVI